MKQDQRGAGRGGLQAAKAWAAMAAMGFVLLAALGLPSPARAAEGLDTSRPIHLVVPLTPGGSADALARIVAEELRTVIPGANVVVENRPGALGAIGTSYVAKAAPDGHTLVLSLGATFSANPTLVKNLSYDPAKDFVHIARLATNGYVLVAGPATQASTVAELVEQGRAHPKQMAFGYGTTTTLVVASTFARLGRFEVLPVSYQAQPPALTDLLGGRTNFMFADVGLLAPYIKSGRIKALATSSTRRPTALPNVPTLEEQGFKGFDLGTWVGISAPAGTPHAIVVQLNEALNRIISRPDIRPRVEALGFDVAPISPEEFTAFATAQEAVWSRSIRDSGVQPQ